MGSTGKARVDYRAVQLCCMIRKPVQVTVKAAKWFIGNQLDDLNGFPNISVSHKQYQAMIPSLDEKKTGLMHHIPYLSGGV